MHLLDDICKYGNEPPHVKQLLLFPPLHVMHDVSQGLHMYPNLYSLELHEGVHVWYYVWKYLYNPFVSHVLQLLFDPAEQVAQVISQGRQFLLAWYSLLLHEDVQVFKDVWYKFNAELSSHDKQFVLEAPLQVKQLISHG